MSIKERQNEVVEEFSMLDEWMDKYEHLISIGKEVDSLNEQEREEKYLIKGCQSRVWLIPSLVDDKIIFKADSDAIITKGIIGLMVRVFSNSSPEEIMNADMEFIDAIGLKEHLSPNRANGLLSMVKQIKMYAIALQTNLNK